MFSLLLLIACADDAPAPAVDPIPRVRVRAAEPPPETLERTVLSELRGCRDATLSARAAGVVERRAATVGERVAAGQALLTLDAREARAALRQAQAALRDAEATLGETRRRLERVEALEDGVSEADLDALRTAALRAEAGVDAAAAQRDRASTFLSYMSVTAPFDGELAALGPDVGEAVGPGAPIARVVDTSSLCVDVMLTAEEVAPAREPASRFSALDAPLTLGWLSPAADPRTRAWAAELRASPGPGLLAGRPVEVLLELAAPGAQAQLPVGSIRQLDGRDVAWVVESGRLRPAALRIVAERGDRALVDGVAPGAQVVVQGPWMLEADLEVQVVEEAP